MLSTLNAADHVWQGQNERVALKAGPATVTLRVTPALSPHGEVDTDGLIIDTAKRHVDAVVLHPNVSAVNHRLLVGGSMGNTPLDGMLT